MFEFAPKKMIQILIFLSLIFSLPVNSFAKQKNKKARVQNIQKKTLETGENQGESALTSQNSLQNEQDSLEVSTEDQWQLLEWEDDGKEFVLYYEIQIQIYNKEKDIYEDFQTVKTENNAQFVNINPQLEPGSYQYNIIPYNLLGLQGEESGWIPFTIYEAYQPVISSISANVSKSSTIYLDEWNDGKFSVSGRNLFEGAEDDDDVKYTTYALVNRKKSKTGVLPPLKIEHKNDRNMEIYYNVRELDIGEYDFVATDASGLESAKGNHSHVTVKFRKWMDFDVSGGYSLPIIFFDDTFPKYLDSYVWPLSLYAKMSFLPIKHNFGNLGLGLSASYTRMDSDFSTYKIGGNMISAFANIIYQRPIYFNKNDEDKRRHRLTFEVHGGAGGVYLMNYVFQFNNGVESIPLNSILPGFDVGGAAQVYITSRLFLELNVDGVVAFAPDMVLGMVQPTIGVGWQF